MLPAAQTTSQHGRPAGRPSTSSAGCLGWNTETTLPQTSNLKRFDDVPLLSRWVLGHASVPLCLCLAGRCDGSVGVGSVQLLAGPGVG